MLGENFATYCDQIKVNNLDEINTTIGEIAKKLNTEYYDIECDKTANMYIVGSLGRGTAIKGSSDVDLIFDLPKEVFDKFDSYDSNGQSALLQEIKNVLEERYPKTKMRGDGQVVVIEFARYTVELVPGFKQDDNSFTYPDTHDGGKWKKTDPLSEQEVCINANEESNGIFYDFCHLIRAWKNHWGFKFGGLLIDTLVYNHFKANNYYNAATKEDYIDILKSLFNYFQSQDKEQKYWLAVGSNQYVYNSDNGKFISKAETAYKNLSQTTEGELLDKLVELFGQDFDNQLDVEINSSYKMYNYRNTEEFIENLFVVDIQYNLAIDCIVSQNGFRDFLLSRALLEKHILRHNKSLKFFIESNEVPMPYNIYWKVRNVGQIAEQNDQIRGEIKCTNRDCQQERTSFRGSHFVECYIVKNQICVARAHIDVPIGDC